MEALIRPSEASKLLKVAPSTLYAMAERGVIGSVRWRVSSANGKRPKFVLRFLPKHLEEFIERHRVEARPTD